MEKASKALRRYALNMCLYFKVEHKFQVYAPVTISQLAIQIRLCIYKFPVKWDLGVVTWTQRPEILMIIHRWNQIYVRILEFI
jgi:hypothetical protein